MKARTEYANEIQAIKDAATKEIEVLRDEQDAEEFKDILGKVFIGPEGEFRATGVTRNTSIHGGPMITGGLICKGTFDPNDLKNNWKVKA